MNLHLSGFVPVLILHLLPPAEVIWAMRWDNFNVPTAANIYQVALIPQYIYLTLRSVANPVLNIISSAFFTLILHFRKKPILPTSSQSSQTM